MDIDPQRSWDVCPKLPKSDKSTLTQKVFKMGRESVHVGWEGVEMKRGAGEKNLEAPEVEDSRIFGQFLVINF